MTTAIIGRQMSDTENAPANDPSNEPTVAPMGRLDAFDVGPKKLTVQTEFFSRPNWRIETKIYLAGALKKLYTEELSGTPESELQRTIDAFHRAKIDEIVAGLRKLQQ